MEIPITIHSDEKGYFDRECPNENCLYTFKINMQDWKEILKDIREEPAMYLLWDNYVAENKYIRELEFHIVLDTVEEVAKLLGL